MINPIYSPDSSRYDNGMKYRRCGRSGILLPEISLGLWHNFGDVNTFANSQAMAHILRFGRRNFRNDHEEIVHALS